MRRDLVLDSYQTIREELFEDVVYTPVGGEPVVLHHAIAGIEPRSERFEVFGEKLRTASHLTRAAREAFPDLRRGDIIDDGARWQVIDFEFAEDGRVEIVMALVRI